MSTSTRGNLRRFLRYARPLVGQMPLMERIQAPRVEKILNK